MPSIEIARLGWKRAANTDCKTPRINGHAIASESAMKRVFFALGLSFALAAGIAAVLTIQAPPAHACQTSNC